MLGALMLGALMLGAESSIILRIYLKHFRKW